MAAPTHLSSGEHYELADPATEWTVVADGNLSIVTLQATLVTLDGKSASASLSMDSIAALSLHEQLGGEIRRMGWSEEAEN